ncbi:MAG: hypothetical protein AB8B58_05665 [Roseobacter sp.]
MTDTVEMDDLTRRLGDSFAVALLQWPPLMAAFALPGEGWALLAKGLCFGWVLLVGLSLIFGRGVMGPRWGLAMGLCAALVALACHLHASLWMGLPLAALLIAFHAALRIRLTEKPQAPDAMAGLEPSTTPQ